MMRGIEGKEGLGKFANDADSAKAGLAKLLIQGAKTWREIYGDIPLPGQATGQTTSVRSSEVLPSRLEPIRFEIEIPTVNAELYDRTREAVENAGYNFVILIRPVSIEDLCRADEGRGVQRFGYVNDSRRMCATVPPEMEVAINPNGFKIEDSNRLPTNDQKTRIKQVEAELKRQVPEAIRNLILMEMVDPSTISQVEDAYMDKHNGELLLPDFFVRTDIQTVQGVVALVGRGGPARRRLVGAWRRGDGNDFVFAPAVVVLPRKLTA